MLSELCELAVVKVGIKGALIKRGSEVVHVGIMAAAKRVDTTGAGDLYAAGFLSGLCEGLTLRQCGTIGAIVAGKVIEVERLSARRRGSTLSSWSRKYGRRNTCSKGNKCRKKRRVTFTVTLFSIFPV